LSEIRSRTPTLFAAALLLATATPALAQYNYFPGDAATDDGRTVALAGDSIETLAQDSLTFILAVPPGVTQFELGIFDGETGQTDGGGTPHWDNRTTQLQYALYYDPFMTGSTSAANLVGVWRGNETNATAGATWTASSATFPDNDWWSLVVDVPEPPEPLPGQSPSGATFYHLCVSYRGETSGGAADPCTGDPRPADAQPQTIANFKIRATTNVSVLSFAFAYEGALRLGANGDLTTIYPEFDGTFPPAGSTFWLDTPTTYDGTWSFNLDVPTSQTLLRLFGGDFDFGTNPAVATTFPSQLPIAPCVDSDDADTPNDAFYPPFAVDGATRIDDSLPEGARTSGGSPSDDSSADIFRRDPCIVWSLTSPGPDQEMATAGDNVTYGNANPSSQREWEQFLVDTAAGCDASPACDPGVSNCADHCESGLLPAGTWRVDVEGVDLSNLNAWRSENVSGFCINCGGLPRPYLVGDTVFEDADGDGTQDAGEAGIPGVLVELVDENGTVVDRRVTGDPGSYGPGEWEACLARNTGADTPLDTAGLYCFDVSIPDVDPEGADAVAYTVRIADGEFTAGGALFDHFGEAPAASLPSPEQSDLVSEGGGNVMTYDFGYFVDQDEECGACQGKVKKLRFVYTGGHRAYVKIKGYHGYYYAYLFTGWVDPGEEFEIGGPHWWPFYGKLGSKIKLWIDRHFVGRVDTDCSAEIGPGSTVGDLEVVYGESKHGGPLCPVGGDDGGSCPASLDFESDGGGAGLVRGQVIDDELAALGIHVTSHDQHRYPAMIFDTAHPTGGDLDLGTPNEDFGGPGIGRGGESGRPGENRRPQGKVLIVSEDGHSWDPDDRQAGGKLYFSFDEPVDVASISVVDVDESGGYVKAYDGDGDVLAAVPLPDLGNNSFQEVEIGAAGVRTLKVRFARSGALAEIDLCPGGDGPGGGGHP